MSALKSLIDDLEAAVGTGTQEKRVDILRHVTELFVGRAGQFNDQEVDLFGDVFGLLIRQVESKFLAELGTRLAPVDNAPRVIVQSLARHNEAAVAGPVLARATQLSDQDLVEIARTSSQEHLGAISERARVAAAVSDVLVERGNIEVVHKLTKNQGAAFSDLGMATLAKRAETDERLAENLGVRIDMPPQLLRELMSKATEAVRARLLAVTPLEQQAEFQDFFSTISSKVLVETAMIRDFRRAEALVAALQQNGGLNEAAMLQFASSARYEEIVAGLARLNSAPIELIDQLMQSARYEGLLVTCKAAELHWATFSAILTNRFSHYRPPAGELEHARSDFIKLSVATAQRMFRFWLVRGISKASAGAAV